MRTTEHLEEPPGKWNANLLRLLLHLKRNHPKLKQLTDRQQQVVAETLEMLPATVCPDCRKTHDLVDWIQ